MSTETETTTTPDAATVDHARDLVGQPGSPGFEGEIGGSMAEFSADYMTYIEEYLRRLEGERRT